MSNTAVQKSGSGPRVILALDYPDHLQALELVDRLSPDQCRLKVGKELFTRAGPDIVRNLVDRGFDVFLDLKYHDIPNTVARACVAAAELGVWMVNIHALGGRRMMAAAREALDNTAEPPLLIGVTILTSMADEELQEAGIGGTAAEAAERLAASAKSEGLDGVVCSAQEARQMKARFGDEFMLVTPGIRPAEDAAGDQRRVMTPADAITAGADYLVMGRAITHSGNPVRKLLTVNSEIDASTKN